MAEVLVQNTESDRKDENMQLLEKGMSTNW